MTLWALLHHRGINMQSLEHQVEVLLSQPSPEQQREQHAKLTRGLGLEVRLDAGDGKGKGVFATQAFAEGQLLFKEPPLAAIQHTANRPEAWVCSHCFRFIGGLEQQIARQIMAVREAAAAELQQEEASDDGSRDDGSQASNEWHREAALQLEEEQLEALATGRLKLPNTDKFLLPRPVRCPGGCLEDWYCSSSCAEAAWQQYHQLLCLGPDGEEEEGQGQAGTASGSSTKGKAPVDALAAGSNKQQHDGEQQGRREALQEFLQHADETNDVFRLAAIVVARVLLEAQRQLDAQQPQQGSSSGVGSSKCAAEPSSDACWQALQLGWQPFAAGHKGLWWECTAAPPEAAADMRQLAEDSLELLTAALPPQLLRRFPALLTLPIWSSIIGMFELNNLSIFVGSPLTRWLQHLEELPEGEQAEAYAVAGPFINSLPEELPGCEGNAFYALHSCCNHSCVPNAEAFKREEDDDGRAVILAVRDIKPGEEITLSYIDEEAPLEERREQLADYGFVCACDKCAAEELAAALQLEEEGDSD